MSDVGFKNHESGKGDPIRWSLWSTNEPYADWVARFDGGEWLVKGEWEWFFVW
jgi:hypothetical protein